MCKRGSSLSIHIHLLLLSGCGCNVTLSFRYHDHTAMMQWSRSGNQINSPFLQFPLSWFFITARRQVIQSPRSSGWWMDNRAVCRQTPEEWSQAWPTRWLHCVEKSELTSETPRENTIILKHSYSNDFLFIRVCQPRATTCYWVAWEASPLVVSVPAGLQQLYDCFHFQRMSICKDSIHTPQFMKFYQVVTLKSHLLISLEVSTILWMFLSPPPSLSIFGLRALYIDSKACILQWLTSAPSIMLL